MKIYYLFEEKSKYAIVFTKYREGYKMTVKAQILEMVDLIPDNELAILLEVVKRFVPIDLDDIVTEDDIMTHNIAMKEYMAGETVSHDEINWD